MTQLDVKTSCNQKAPKHNFLHVSILAPEIFCIFKNNFYEFYQPYIAFLQFFPLCSIFKSLYSILTYFFLKVAQDIPDPVTVQ